jgi:holin-like protein
LLNAFLILMGCQLLGELIRRAVNLPLPSTVIGMFLLTAVLAMLGKRPEGEVRMSLTRTAEILLTLMGLFFVPAGVGVIAEAGLLKSQWLPIVVAVVGSTVLSAAVTGWVMHWTLTSSGKNNPASEASGVFRGGRPP